MDLKGKDKDKDKEMVLISARVSRDVANGLQDFAVLRNSSRSQAAADALAFYANAKQCVICGEMNPGKAEHCFSCGSDLFSDEDIQYAIEGLCEDGEYDEVSGGSSLDKLEDLKRAGFYEGYEPNIWHRLDGTWSFSGSLFLDLEGLKISAAEMDTSYRIFPERLLERLKKDRKRREELREKRMMEETKE